MENTKEKAMPDAEDEEFNRIEMESRNKQDYVRDLTEALRMAVHERNAVLEEVAKEFDRMTSLGDTAASFAAYVRGMKG